MQLKIAVTTQGSEQDAAVDLRFGRARFFRIVDMENGLQTVVDNADGVNAVQGAGMLASQTLASHGVQVLLTGHVGPKAWTALEAANIQVYEISGGTAQEAITSFTEGHLRKMSHAEPAK